ncbi:MAG: right-handed parallel beta-helix repeat-containing protein [Candidatus Micrarchaeia archaeon]|jgi:hypothetical protein
MSSAANAAKILLFVILVQSAYAITGCTDLNVSGAYVLENSITDTGALQCINISVSDVSLDGGGFTVDGTDATTSTGIYVYNSSATLNNITIGNVTVTDFANGIGMRSVQNSSVLDSTVASNVMSGLDANYSVGITISGMYADNNSASGTFVGGIHFNSVNSSSIINSRLAGNTRYTILFYPAGNVNITNNTIINGSKAGIATWYVKGGYIVDNIIANLSWQGIDHSGSNDTVIEGNNVTGALLGGILLSFFSYNNSVTGNIVASSGVRGMVNVQSVNNTFEGNVVYNTTGMGFSVLNSTNNTFDGNTAYNNTFNGFILNLSENTVLTNNEVFNNSPYGIYILNSSESYLDGNEIYLNNVTGGAGVMGINASYTTAIRNLIYDNYEGIFIKFSTMINITNNSFDRHGKEAMRIIAVNGSWIMNNTDNNSVEQSIQMSEIPTTYNPAVRNVLISGNHFYGNVDDGGIGMYPLSENVTIIENEVVGSSYGLKIMDGAGFVVANNTFVGTNYDFSVIDYNISKNNRSYCNHFVENNTGYAGKPIFYSNESVNVTGGEYSVFLLCGADNSIIDGIGVSGDAAYRSNFIWVGKSENVTLVNARMNNTYYGLVVYEWSSNFRGNNITSENGRDEGIFIGISNNSLLGNSTITGAEVVGLWLSSVVNTTVENVFISNNSGDGGRYSEITMDKLMLYGDTTDYGNPANNTLRNVTIHSSSNYVYHNSTGENVLENFSICADSQLLGCVRWDSIILNSKQQLNASNFIVDNYFASLNSSFSNASLFNSSANITLAADCSAGVMHGIYRKAGFPSSAADIIANGTFFSPTHMECAGGYATFSAVSFSGYALQEGTINVTISPFSTMLPHTETNASCDSSEPSAMLGLYRDGVLVANGTSHVEDVQTLESGTYVYECNATNYSASYATDTLVVRAQGTGNSARPMSVSVSGDEVGSELTITVRDGSTPVSDAEVRVLYWMNGILNAIELGETDANGQVSFTPTLAGEYTAEAKMVGYGAVEFAFSVEAPEYVVGEEEPVAQVETQNLVPETGCAGGCPAGYGCMNVECVRIGQPVDEDGSPSGILPVSTPWSESREVSSAPEQQGAAPEEGADGPINHLVIIVPLVVAAVLVLLSRRRGKGA